jgi:hypothetical protein
MRYATIDEANQAVTEKMRNTQPFLLDVVPAKTVIPFLEEKALLHSGPENTWEHMADPVRGSCIGAALFEGWAADEAEARALFEQDKIAFSPCNHHQAVGPMGGITSGNMPVLVVENRENGNRAFCTMNEGIGQVLRFGAYSQEVIDRLRWMKNTLAPSLSKALHTMEDGLNLNVLLAKAITMGDEFHQRNIAASALFLKDMLPALLSAGLPERELKEVAVFLGDTDQFFLNIAMAAAKATMDAAATITEGSIVTLLSRNGYEFGIKVSGLGDRWFTGRVNTPEGLYFSGYSQKDASPDMGDSAILESLGLGAMSMIAAPGVTRFVGAGGGYDDAAAISEEMQEICIAHNSNYGIPTWNFQGSPLGIDIRKVVETGITPVINTGIAHKKAGVGQIGAGTVRVPLECFEKALVALGEVYGIK